MQAAFRVLKILTHGAITKEITFKERAYVFDFAPRKEPILFDEFAPTTYRL